MKRREVEMLWKPGKIELLAPARDLRSARAAIDCGADAVYMGGPRFGARQAAGNSVADIAAVAEYARRFGVRVYVTLNTLLFDDELADAERIARQVVEAGADALIVQDMAYLEMELEGVELHASTQTFNASPEKAAFLADCGFSRVILERNLSLEEIRRIRAATDVELECFVHGAICVCYSGRCYMSRTMSPRSGNRGDCMQACRLPYDLLDAAGNVLMAGKHLLSVRDMDLSGRLGDLLDAGVTSFKIEGRLKDEAYVRNVVAWYRTRLDREIAARPGLVRASEGQSDPGFEPDLARTFSRGRTEYFFDGRRAGYSEGRRRFRLPGGAFRSRVVRAAGRRGIRPWRRHLFHVRRPVGRYERERYGRGARAAQQGVETSGRDGDLSELRPPVQRAFGGSPCPPFGTGVRDREF